MGLDFNRDDYLTVEEVVSYYANLLEASTIRSYFRDGTLRGRRIGRGKRAQILITKESVRKLDEEFSGTK